LSGHGAIGVLVAVLERFLRLVLIGLGDREFAEHLPAHIEQQHAAGDEQPPAERQKLGGDEREEDAQQRRRENTDKDRLAAHIRGKPRRSQADHDGIVASQNQVDKNDLNERAQETRVNAEHGWDPQYRRESAMPRLYLPDTGLQAKHDRNRPKSEKSGPISGVPTA